MDKDTEFNNNYLKMLTETVNLLPEEHRPNPLIYYEYYEQAFLKNPTLKNWQGYLFKPGFEPETAKYAYEDWEPKKGDILIASFPKSGTTWTRELTRNIVYLNNEEQLNRTKVFNHFFAYLEFGPVSKYQVTDNLSFPRRILGTHLPAQLINFEKMRKKGVKIIYVIRNPKDVAVSWYPFVRADRFMHDEFWQKRYPEDENKFLDLYIGGKQSMMSIEGEGHLEHVKAWNQHKSDDNVLFLTYEEMKQEIKKEVGRIAQFIDVPLSDEEVDRVCENSSLDSMKKAWSKPGLAGMPFIRKGKVGDWKNHLTVAQSELIDKKVEEVLGDTGIKFIYNLD